MKKLFKDLTIGETFHDGRGFGSGIHSKTQQWVEFKKTNKSEAIIEKLIGWGNQRGLGNLKRFSAYASVFTLEQ